MQRTQLIGYQVHFKQPIYCKVQSNSLCCEVGAVLSLKSEFIRI